MLRSPAWSTLLLVVAPSITLAQAPASSPEIVAQVQASRARLAAEEYVLPPAEIVKLVTTPRQSSGLGQQSPDGRLFLREESEGMPSLKDFGKFHYYFAGLQVDPAANRARALTTRGAARLRIVDATTGVSRSISIPAGARVTAPAWSPDGKQIAFIANFPNASHAWVADVATGSSRQVTPANSPLLATLATSLDWSGDGSRLIVVLIPANRGPEPARPAVAQGPLVRVWTDTTKSPQRNFASLLSDPFDQALMEYHTTGQIAIIDLRSRAIQRLGSPAMIANVDPSPDGKYFRVTTMQRPFSYIVQYQNFGQVEEIWDAAGTVLAQVTKRPLRESPDTGDTPGPRQDGSKRGLSWLPSGEGLYYLEPVPGRSGQSGDSGAARPGQGGGNRPDRLVKWSPPFGPADTTVLYRGDGPLAQVVLSEDGKLAFFAATRSGQGELFAVDLSRPNIRYSIVRQRNYTPVIAGLQTGGFGGGGGRGGPSDSAFYQNPGALATRRGPHGRDHPASSCWEPSSAGTTWRTFRAPSSTR